MCVTSNTQKIQSSDWLKWRCTLWRNINPRVFSGMGRHFNRSVDTFIVSVLDLFETFSSYLVTLHQSVYLHSIIHRFLGLQSRTCIDRTLEMTANVPTKAWKHVASDTQTIQFFGWLKWRNALWTYDVTQLPAFCRNQASFQVSDTRLVNTSMDWLLSPMSHQWEITSEAIIYFLQIKFAIGLKNLILCFGQPDPTYQTGRP